MSYDPRSYERNINTSLETTKEKSNPLALIREFSLVMFSLFFNRRLSKSAIFSFSEETENRYYKARTL